MDAADGAGGRTPLHLAANSDSAAPNFLPVVRCLLREGADWSLTCGDGRTIREAIRTKTSRSCFKFLEGLSDAAFCTGGQSIGSAVKQSIVAMIEEAELKGEDDEGWEDFQKAVEEASLADLEFDSVGEVGLLQRAAEADLPRHVGLLLRKGLNPNRFAEGTLPPVILAARRGNFQVLRVLKEAGRGEAGGFRTDFSPLDRTKSSVLHSVLRRPYSEGLSLQYTDEQMEERYLRCLEIILEEGEEEEDDEAFASQIRRVVNARDELDNTALHYATQLWPQSVVRRLLERGANVGVRNAYAEVPVEAILPSTMEDFLTGYCLRARGDPTNKDFRVTVKYDFLAPPRDDEAIAVRSDAKRTRREGWTAEEGPRNGGVIAGDEDGEGGEGKQKPSKDADGGEAGQGSDEGEGKSRPPPMPETEVLWHMSQSRKHRHLLKHPVITSFLWLKWKRISSAYNKNVVFYFAFVVCLTAYIFALFGAPKIADEKSCKG